MKLTDLPTAWLL